MIHGIDHVAIAVEDLDAAIALFENVLGMKVTHREDIAGYGVRVATVATGGTDVELVQGTTPDSPISKFVAARGPGMHHIAFAVDDIEKALAGMKERGVDLIDQTPRPGKQGSRVAFIHPKATGRVLCELVQNRR
ncbi:MAG TPA: methylmalonyl-CoA epimerase [Candidatus Krumholzibacteria bacterium]|nr:methylmalonyl-CoA epimerase [Candidatus Krumholzibacteria bacterium]